MSGAEIVNHIFDLNGNITGIGNKILAYNQDNRLVRAEEGGTVLGEYIYNGLGQRIIKAAGGTTTVFLYDFDGNIIAETDQTGSISKEYLYKGSSRLAMVDVLAGKMYYYGNDKLGTPQIMTDSTNTIVWEADYKPFGEAEVNPNSSVVNNFRFPGQYYDAETGLHYNYHRYYDPKMGRYVTPDPIGQTGGIKLYVYSENNPISMVDPIGLFVEGSYNRTTGQLSITDLDTGNRMTIPAESGGKPFGEPIPPGTYDILEQQGHIGFYRLDKRDTTPYDDVIDAAGRSHLRLHRPGRTTGCIAAKDSEGWKELDDLIKKTQRTDKVPDNFKPWWKFWPTTPSIIKRYGTLRVY